MIQHSSDTYVEQIDSALKAYKSKHPDADIKVKRHNSAAVWICIVDSIFEGKGLAAREEEVWPILEQLPADVREEISMLLLVPPSEANDSLLDSEF